jgi:hypothetical protein
MWDSPYSFRTPRTTATGFGETYNLNMERYL